MTLLRHAALRQVLRPLGLVIVLVGLTPMTTTGCGDSGDGASSSVAGSGGGGGGTQGPPCTSSGQCSGDTPYCPVGGGRCVQCLGDANCGGTGEPYCDTQTHRCVDCTNDGQCGGGNPYCVTGSCVECTTAAQCGQGRTCNLTQHECVDACATDGDCSIADGTPYCDPGRAVCVECVGDGNCGPDQPYCIAGQCEECVSDSNCSGGDPYCRVETHRCVECLGNGNCQPGEVCVNFQCQG